MRSCVHLLCALALLHAPASASEEPKKEPAKDYDVAILEHFKVKTDTQSLLKWLSDKSSDDETLLAIPELIKQLGAEQFRQRDAAGRKLVAIGLPALWPLRDAMNDKDPERARLAKQCLEHMDRGTHTVSVPPCSIRLLMRRKPDGLLDLLLRYLPYTTDPEVEEDIYYNIDELRDGKIPECLLKALDDKVAARRAIAGCIIAKNGNPDQKKAAERLLKDPDPNVRLRTAQGFLAAGEKTGIPTLIDLLEAKPVSVAWQAEELLSWGFHGTPGKYVGAGGETARVAKQTWYKAWQGSGPEREVAKMREGKSPPRLYMLSSSLVAGDGAKLVGSDGLARWQFAAPDEGVVCLQCFRNDQLLAVLWNHSEKLVKNPLAKEGNLRIAKCLLDGTVVECFRRASWADWERPALESLFEQYRELPSGELVGVNWVEGNLNDWIKRLNIDEDKRRGGGEAALLEGRKLGMIKYTGNGSADVISRFVEMDPLSGDFIAEHRKNAFQTCWPMMVPHRHNSRPGFLIARGRVWVDLDEHDELPRNYEVRAVDDRIRRDFNILWAGGKQIIEKDRHGGVVRETAADFLGINHFFAFGLRPPLEFGFDSKKVSHERP